MSSHQLISKQEDSFETEFPVAEVEEVLKTGTEELHHHDVVVMLHPVILDQGDAHPTLHHLKQKTNVWKNIKWRISKNGVLVKIKSNFQIKVMFLF